LAKAVHLCPWSSYYFQTSSKYNISVPFWAEQLIRKCISNKYDYPLDTDDAFGALSRLSHLLMRPFDLKRICAYFNDCLSVLSLEI
jgi:hypothetical protein